jgi:hypothetical protein
MHDILILTEPVELVGMLKSQTKCTIILTEPVELVGMQNHNLNARYQFSLNQWSWWNAKITTQMRYLNFTEPVELVGMLKSQLKCTIS